MIEYEEKDGELVLVCDHNWGDWIDCWYGPLNKFLPQRVCHKCLQASVVVPCGEEFK